VRKFAALTSGLFVATLLLVGTLGSQGLAQRDSKAADKFQNAAPRVGEAVPDFALKTIAGQEVLLSDLCQDKQVVLEFGSISCPIFRARIPHMQRLRQHLGDAAHVIVVYTLEAHPADVNSPYANRVWVHPKNVEEGLSVNQPTTYDERVALAQRTADEFGVSLPILVDGMDNAVWEAYGKRPNSAFIIDQQGKVSAKQFWCNPRELVQKLGQAGSPGGRQRDIQAEGVRIERDTEYGNAGGVSLLLDAYLPEEGGPHPAVVQIHGGGWRSGDKSGFAREAVSYAQDGIAAFSLNYRLSDVATYPAAVDDCVTAMRFLRTNAERFNINPDRMAVKGGSAGAHLALMMAFLEPGEDEVNAAGEPIRNRVVCVVSQSGPTDFTALDDMKTERALVAFMGGPYEENQEAYRQASPVTHVSADDPPTLVLHGDVDRTVPYSQATILRDRMEEIGVPVELITIEGGGHGGFRGGQREAIMAARRRAAEFIREHLLGAD